MPRGHPNGDGHPTSTGQKSRKAQLRAKLEILGETAIAWHELEGGIEEHADALLEAARDYGRIAGRRA